MVGQTCKNVAPNDIHAARNGSNGDVGEEGPFPTAGVRIRTLVDQALKATTRPSRSTVRRRSNQEIPATPRSVRRGSLWKICDC